ncbi:hypothetical protein RsoM2USA_317 [Ralstonia phage RsoM2USA]|nr:hypothetical protein RsoM2USA_317 [Ralstonia phage RsoM2USA]
MKLNEISGRDQLSYEWMKWIENNFTVSEGQKMLNRISVTGDLMIPAASELYGRGKPFAPPGKVIDGRWVGLNDYDFVNSDFSKLQVLDQLELFVTDEADGILGDLARVCEKVQSNPEIVKRLHVIAARDRITNVCEAAEIFPHFILRIRDFNSNKDILDLDAARKHVTDINDGTTHFYSSVFELQEFLINNGFEDIA